MDKIAYTPGSSMIHKLDARVKIIMLLLFSLVIFSTKNFYIISSIFLIVLTAWMLSGISLKKLAGFLKLMLVLIAMMIAIQAIFQRGETVLFGPVTLEGLMYGLLISYRLITLFMLMPLIIMTTNVYHISLGLVKMKMPYKYAYMATTALNMVPTLQEEIQTIMEAKKLRASSVYEDGNVFQKLKAYPTLVVPLVISTMRRAYQMGIAMDARSFAIRPQRTYLMDFHMSKRDILALSLVIIAAIAMTVANLMV